MKAEDRTNRETYEAGMTVRREVLGDKHVDAANARIDATTADFQDLITRYAWGDIWTRPGLDRKTRSVITITALIAHGHYSELAMHLRAAQRNGLSRARDQRGDPADRHLLRRARGEHRVRSRAEGVRRRGLILLAGGTRSRALARAPGGRQNAVGSAIRPRGCWPPPPGSGCDNGRRLGQAGAAPGPVGRPRLARPRSIE